MSLKEKGFVYIGSFGVDSGQVLITDPCYIDSGWKPWNDKEEPFDNHKEKKGQYGYLGAAGVTLDDQFGPLAGFLGVVSTTGYGDGMYPVYAKLENIGTDEIPDQRVSQIVIDFFGEFDKHGELD